MALDFMFPRAKRIGEFSTKNLPETGLVHLKASDEEVGKAPQAFDSATLVKTDESRPLKDISAERKSVQSLLPSKYQLMELGEEKIIIPKDSLKSRLRKVMKFAEQINNVRSEESEDDGHLVEKIEGKPEPKRVKPRLVSFTSTNRRLASLNKRGKDRAFKIRPNEDQEDFQQIKAKPKKWILTESREKSFERTKNHEDFDPWMN
ncbi:unnamed protein product, partial [Mesorhabditis belari]|uniref:Uncharacterized protein n=1 Tax=Mesorhabditis belari TaxID=2138241 RepID=A0AAF3EGH0_9BILA